MWYAVCLDKDDNNYKDGFTNPGKALEVCEMLYKQFPHIRIVVLEDKGTFEFGYPLYIIPYEDYHSKFSQRNPLYALPGAGEGGRVDFLRHALAGLRKSLRGIRNSTQSILKNILMRSCTSVLTQSRDGILGMK